MPLASRLCAGSARRSSRGSTSPGVPKTPSGPSWTGWANLSSWTPTWPSSNQSLGPTSDSLRAEARAWADKLFGPTAHNRSA